jgi:hypothetical protein
MRYIGKPELIWLSDIATTAARVSRITSLRWQGVLKAGLLAIPALAVGPAFAEDGRVAKAPRVAPILSKPEGQTYGRWAAEWWQWALGVPLDTNPLVDETGEQCTQRQVDNVWFLAGTVVPGPVVRECTIPEGKALFFPLINNFSGAFLSDPPEARTEEFVRAQAACAFPVELFAEIDGFEIRRLDRFFTGKSRSQSPVFNVQLPPGNIFGAVDDPNDPNSVPELVLTPSAEQGYYLFVSPLSLGEHTVRWLAEGCSGPEVVQDITYKLTIVPAEDQVADVREEAAGRLGGLSMPGGFRDED